MKAPTLKHKLSRLWFSLLLGTLFAVAASLISPLAQAGPAIVCGGGCISYHDWGDITAFPIHGGASKFTISDPGMSGSSSFWRRSLDLFQYNSFWYAEIGVERDGGFSVPAGSRCGATYGAGLYWYYVVWNASDVEIYRDCVDVRSDDYNTDNYFQGGYYVSGGGGLLVYIQSPYNDALCQKGCYLSGVAQTWDYMEQLETDQNTWTGHNVYGSHWIDNKYQDNSTGAWHYQPGSCVPGVSSCITARNPPQMHWHTIPEQSSTRGELYSCDYDTGTECMYGS